MASQAAVELLIEKGRFEPQVALAVAEAMSITMTEAHIVTVPILDARISELKAELKADLRVSIAHLEKMFGVALERTKTELIRWVFVSMMGSAAISVAALAVRDLIQHAH